MHRLYIKHKTSLIMQYLFFVLGLVIGVIEQGSMLFWVCLIGASICVALMYTRLTRFEQKVKRLEQREGYQRVKPL